MGRVHYNEEETRRSTDVTCPDHGERADGELRALLRLDEHGDALARLGLEAQRRLRDHDGVAILRGELLGLLAAAAAMEEEGGGVRRDAIASGKEIYR